MSYNLLKGKRGIILGALDKKSIAWQAALKIKKEGGNFVLTNTPIALRLGEINRLAQTCNSQVIPADASSVEDLENLIGKSVEILGGKIDFILHSVGMSPNIRKKTPYHDLNYEWFNKTIDISALSFHKLLHVADRLDSLNHEASIIALSYIAAQRVFPKYTDMADTKAMLESIARSFGYYLGKKKQVRINTISQSPTFTTAGQGVPGLDKFMDYTEKMSPLGNASSQDCAAYIVLMFSDLSKMVTMQNLMHDGGFSTTGVSEEMLNIL